MRDWRRVILLFFWTIRLAPRKFSIQTSFHPCSIFILITDCFVDNNRSRKQFFWILTSTECSIKIFFQCWFFSKNQTVKNMIIQSNLAARCIRLQRESDDDAMSSLMTVLIIHTQHTTQWKLQERTFPAHYADEAAVTWRTRQQLTFHQCTHTVTKL